MVEKNAIAMYYLTLLSKTGMQFKSSSGLGNID
jgi:hypothetical protein